MKKVINLAGLVIFSVVPFLFTGTAQAAEWEIVCHCYDKNAGKTASYKIKGDSLEEVEDACKEAENGDSKFFCQVGTFDGMVGVSDKEVGSPSGFLSSDELSY